MIKKILVSQPKPTSDKSPYFAIERDYDVELVFRPFIKVEGISSKDFRQQHVSPADELVQGLRLGIYLPVAIIEPRREPLPRRCS